MQVCGQEFSPELVERIETTVRTQPELSRSALSRQVCEWLDWSGPDGRLKAMSARVALLRLERAGHIRLPVARRAPPGAEVGGGAESAQDAAALELGPVSMRLCELGAVELVVVGESCSESARVWRALMRRYHPLGAGPLCGAQLRYLIRSREHGWLGGISFSAAAWRVAARDEHIGWSEVARREHLNEVVCNSRFLIRPEVRVAHLASHVLGQATRRLAADWNARYGYAPVLVESYVECARYRGTCYRAANWRQVGCTRGRGRQDRARRAARAVKAVYLYPLVRNWRQRLCAASPSTPVPCTGEDWAHEEFGRVHLGDARLERRVLTVARDLYAQPQAQLPQACATVAKTKAAYRLFDHERVTMDSLLHSHYEASAARVSEHPRVLAVQDSTSLNYTAHPSTEGLGPLNTKRDHSVGLWMHDTLAFTPDGTPLGLLDVQCWARDADGPGRATRYQRGIQDKESRKWLTGFEALCRLQQRCPGTELVSVGDREADVYELLVRAQRPGAAKLLIRAERTRRMVAQHGALWPFMAQQPLAGTQELEIPRRHNQARRIAQLQVRYAEVTLQAPKRKSHLGTVRLWAVWAYEPAPPEGVKGLDWMLLSTVPVHSFDDALERLAWYRERWGIEVYHRTLKSGCRIQDRQLGSAKRLEACLAIDLVVAWRIFHLCKLGRETPELPCTVYFEDAQWRALSAKVHRRVPEQPPTLREAMRMVASLGGFLGRKGDGEPGTKTLWRGLQRLDDLTDIYRYFTEELGFVAPTVSSKQEYG